MLTKTQRNIFLVFYQTVGVQQKFNIDYIQLSRLDFIHFILMHSQTSQFQFQVTNQLPRILKSYS